MQAISQLMGTLAWMPVQCWLGQAHALHKAAQDFPGEVRMFITEKCFEGVTVNILRPTDVYVALVECLPMCEVCLHSVMVVMCMTLSAIPTPPTDIPQFSLIPRPDP